MKRRLFSILLALCMALAMLPAAAFAGESSYDSDITIKHSGWTFKSDKEVGYYIPTTNGKFSVNQPNSDSYLKVTKTGENEITITVHGNVALQGKAAISFKDANAIKSIKNLIITGATGKDTLSLSTTKDGTAISVLGDLTITGIALTATAGNGHALRANNITVSDATLIATNNSADSAAIQATQGDGPLGNLTVSGTSAITVTNKNANGCAIHATIINGNTDGRTLTVNGNETPGQTDASQVTISSPAPHTHRFDGTWTADTTNHWKTCNDCGAIIEKAAHIGGTATCTAKKKCEVCGEPYGGLDTSNHTALSGWASDETHHWKTCSACNTDIEKSAHTFDDWIIDKEATATEAGAKCRECSVCHYKETATIPPIPCTHEGSTWEPADDGVHHMKKCTDCGAEPVTEKHNFAYRDNGDNSHTMTCDVCGEARIEPHDFSHKTVPADGGKHRGQCICGAFDAAEEHTFENGKCTVCGAADPTPAKPTPGGSGIIITPKAADPAFLSGANQTVALGSAAAFRIDYNYAAFRSVAVDGFILDPTSYTTWDGSTWVKLTAAYTKSLTPGTHTLSVYFDGATAATTFTVGGQPNPATGARDAVGIAAAAAVIALLGSAAVLRKK